MMSKSKEQKSLLKLKTKIEITKLKINFLKKCKRNGFKPAFIQVKMSVRNDRTESVKKVAEKLWLKFEIRYHYSSLVDMERRAYELHLRLTKDIVTLSDRIRWDSFDEFMNEIVMRETTRRRKVLDKKYKEMRPRLTTESPEMSTYLDGFVKNFSSIALTPEEDALLNKGLKFCLPPTRPPVDELIVDVMSSVDKFPEEAGEEINEVAMRSIKNLKRTSQKNKQAEDMANTIKGLKKKPIIIAKADKSNNVVIMDKDDYGRRMDSLILEGGYVKIDSDPLNSMVNRVNEVLKKYSDLLCDNPQRELRKWKNSNPKVPRLYGYAKTHKLADLTSSEGLKMRPVASNIDAPTEKIAKWLVTEFRKLTPPKGKSVKNAQEFMEVMKDVKIKRNETIGSYDVISLFPSIPMGVTYELLRLWLMKNNVTGRKAEMYEELTRLCMEQNVFVYNGEFYAQLDGTAIGNSLSSFIAELYMCHFETKIENHPAFPREYVRFVDDIFAIQNARKVKETLELFNSQHPRVQFTYEPAKENKIAFLDTMVTNVNGNLEFEVYRKPCATERVIMNDSHQDVKHKMAAFHSMAHRLVTFTLKDDAYWRERERILEIGQVNGYKKESIERIIRKHERKKQLSNYSTFYSLPRETTEEENLARVSMVYCPEVTKKLRPIYKMHNIDIVHRSGNNIRQNLNSLKDKIPDTHKSGIYKVECQNDCPFKYIGRTLRRTAKRYAEHKSDWVKKKCNDSAVAAHLLKYNHKINDESLSLIRPYSDSIRIDSMEAVYIHKYKHTPLMNKNLGKVSPLLMLIDPVMRKDEKERNTNDVQ